jgi:hypothetical protein
MPSEAVQDARYINVGAVKPRPQGVTDRRKAGGSE